jgi:hypothetical protein
MARRIPDLTRVKSLIGYQPKVGLDEIIARFRLTSARPLRAKSWVLSTYKFTPLHPMRRSGIVLCMSLAETVLIHNPSDS